MQARFVFNAAQALPWVVPADLTHAPVDPDGIHATAICWRLLSPNNRQLGRSADVYDDLASCLLAVDEFLVRLPVAEPLVTRDTRPVRWTWRVLLGNHVVAMSGRSFETERQAARTLDNFLTTAPLATVVPGVVGHPAARPDPLVEPPIQLIERRRIR